jgi:2OG-Fe(II) oxygenase superfamily
MTTTTPGQEGMAKEGTGALDCQFQSIMANAWLVPKLLSDGECNSLRGRARLSLTNEDDDGGVRGEGQRGKRDDRHRTNHSVVVKDKDLAERVWERIKDQVPAEIVIHPHDKEVAGIEKPDLTKLQGKWVAVCLNDHWRVAVYDGGGHFGPHRDAYRSESEHRRSFITVNGYLVGLPPGYGGATRYLRDDQDAFLDETTGRFAPAPGSVLHTVAADTAGKAVVFFHGLLHDGEPIDPKCPVEKWIYRTDIMYERDENSIMASWLTASQREARQHLEEAQRLEANGQLAEARINYNRAYRLDPALDK